MDASQNKKEKDIPPLIRNMNGTYSYLGKKILSYKETNVTETNKTHIVVSNRHNKYELNISNYYKIIL